MTEAEMRKLAIAHALRLIESWLYEDMGEKADENGVTFDEWGKVCDFVRDHVEVVINDAN